MFIPDHKLDPISFHRHTALRVLLYPQANSWMSETHGK